MVPNHDGFDPRTSLVELELPSPKGGHRVFAGLCMPGAGGRLDPCAGLASEGDASEGADDEQAVTPTHAFVGIDPSGAIMGVARRLRAAWPTIRIVAVDVAGSVVFGASGEAGRASGAGSSRVAEPLDIRLIDEVVFVTQAEAVEGSRFLAEHEEVLAAGSVIAAITRMASDLPRNAAIVTVTVTVPAGRGERFRDGGEAWSRPKARDRLRLDDRLPPRGRRPPALCAAS